ncbi:MAG: S9 family peptidase [Helicobacter sp.]|nr:S9 family peptidase [Helicobacter sp.]
MDKKPGNTALPSSDKELEALVKLAEDGQKYKVEDFFKLPETFSYQISPDGKYLSFRARNKAGKSDIYLQDLQSGKKELLYSEGDNVIRGYSFVNSDTIIFTQDFGGDENYHIYSLNIFDKNVLDLTPFEGVRAQISNILKDDKDHIIIELNKTNKELFEPYKLNLKTANLTKLYDNVPSEEPIGDFIFDKDGVLRVFSRIIGGQDEDIYCIIDDKDVKLKHVPFGEIFSIIGFDYKGGDRDIAFVLSNEKSDKAAIYRYNLRKNEYLECIFSHDVFDAGGISRSYARNYEIDYFYYNGQKPTKVPISAEYKAWVSALESHLGCDNEISIVDLSDDEKVLLVFVTSDKEPGIYYIFYPELNKLEKLTELLPHLARSDMGSMIPIIFKSRDGIDLHGYFTKPAKAKEGEKIPVVVIVHGGPQGVRDSFGFSAQNQLFASRGFGVLQVNFRISGGYGKAFFNAGIGKIGQVTMDDVEDGLAYIIKQGWCDKDKVAIYGGSHGGYAVLRGLYKTPDLYSCGVDYVGVANLWTFMQSIPPYWEIIRKALYRIWYDPTNPEHKDIMNEVSPLQNAHRIQKPLFVVQGANDPRVNINESDQIVESLRARGLDVPYMVKYDEGHGFAKEENRLHMQKAMLGFISQYLK